MQRYFFFYLILFVTTTVFGQQEDALLIKQDHSQLNPVTIHEDDLSKYKKNEAFNYVEAVKQESLLNRFVAWLKSYLIRFFEAIFGLEKATGIVKFILSVLPYLLLALLVYLLVKFFLKVNSKQLISGAPNPATLTFSDDEAIINNQDIVALINKAISKQNYRLAIRYHYLLALKQLTQKNYIKWQQEKTNEDYLTELNNTELQAPFRAITKIYDYVWYGEFNIDQLKFETLRTPFNTIQNTLNPIAERS